MTTIGASGWNPLPTSRESTFTNFVVAGGMTKESGNAEAGIPDTGAEYLRLVNEAFGSNIAREDWVSLRKEAMVFRPDVIGAVEFAKQHGQVTLLTNNGMLIGEHLADIAPHLVPVFGEHMFATAHYGARKPDTLVYERVLERYRAKGAGNIFCSMTPHENTPRGQRIRNHHTVVFPLPTQENESLVR